MKENTLTDRELRILYGVTSQEFRKDKKEYLEDSYQSDLKEIMSKLDKLIK